MGDKKNSVITKKTDIKEQVMARSKLPVKKAKNTTAYKKSHAYLA